jgi:hypothetical protein
MGRKAKSSIVESHWKRFATCYSGHKHFMREAVKNEKFFFGDQWSKEDRAAMKEAKRPLLTVNMTKANLRDMLGTFIQSRYRVSLSSYSSLSEEELDVRQRLIDYIYEESDMDELRQRVFLDALMIDRGFYQVELDTSKSTYGDLRVIYRDPMTVIPDPAANSPDPSKWSDVFYFDWASFNDLRNMFGLKMARRVRSSVQRASDESDVIGEGYAEAASDIDELHMSEGVSVAGEPSYEHLMVRAGMSGRTPIDSGSEALGEDALSDDYAKVYRVVTREYREMKNRPHFVNASTGQIIEVPTGMSDADRKEYMRQNDDIGLVDMSSPQLRLAVFVGDVLLYDKPSPYPDINLIPVMPMFVRGKSSGIGTDFRGPQIMLNKLLSAEVLLC